MVLPFLSSLKNPLRPDLKTFSGNTECSSFFVVDLLISIGDVGFGTHKPLQVGYALMIFVGSATGTPKRPNRVLVILTARSLPIKANQDGVTERYCAVHCQ